LFDELCKDATLPESAHDFGRNIIPTLVGSRRVFAFPFRDENRKADAYWRDVGTIDAYYQANIELTAVEPHLNLYDDYWPIRTHQPNLPPAKFVFNSNGRRGTALDSIVSSGVIVSGGSLIRSVIGPRARVNSYAEVSDSILFAGVNVGRRAKIHRAIIDKGVCSPEGARIGLDPDEDRSNGYLVTESGVTVIAKADNPEPLASVA
jgi:glucose-1-phosphate adenylyltransferase